MIKNDGILNIATGKSATSVNWKNTKLKWSEFVDRLSKTTITNETYKDFLKATKLEQSRIKDVGAYVGGYLRNGRRTLKSVVCRQLITLDLDAGAPSDFWDRLELQYHNATVVHGTHKWHPDSPHYRLLMPLNREVAPEEYSAIARSVAGSLGIDFFDDSGFDVNRLMYWPSTPKDVDYYFRVQDGEWLDADRILKSYKDWKDSSLWPTSKAEFEKVKDSASKQEDPETKKGIVGAFCRTYDIEGAIEKYLTEVYAQGVDGRYTYIKGTASSGLVVYDGKFAYSHHGTDPCGSKLCNSFDLVRIHKFGHFDEGQKSQGVKSASFKKMEELAISDLEVKKVLASEKLASSKYEFNDGFEDIEPAPQQLEDDLEWMKELEVDRKGNILSTAGNISTILAKDSRLKGVFRLNLFDRKRYVFGALPWKNTKEVRTLEDNDYAGVRNYLEITYGVSSSLKVLDSLSLEFEKYRYNPVKDYLQSVKWDGVKRADILLIKYFGAEDTVYTREAMRKMLVGAVARIFNPGCKFDLVLTLVSPIEGAGKSSFFKALGRGWFSDTFTTFQGKEAFEQIQGSWIIEMAELSALKKSDVETTKHFISKQEDVFRAAYARVTETRRRQCVFVATTNKTGFLKDVSGNRRFMPVDVECKELTDNSELAKFLTNTEEVDQIWAEAVHLYRSGETLYLGRSAEGLAKAERKEHMEVDERKGIIENYLNTLLPEDWDGMDTMQRRLYLSEDHPKRGVVKRDAVCIAEIWVECLGKEKEAMNRYATREINDVLRTIDGWTFLNSTKRFKLYGTQKYYKRI